MRRFAYAIFIFLLLVSPGRPSFAQGEKPLEAAWLAQDVKAIHLLAQLLPIENQSLESVKRLWGKAANVEQEDLGFGAQRIHFTKASGYAQFYLDLLVFDDRIGYYEVGVRGSAESWDRIRNVLMAAWKQNSGTEYEERENGLSQRKSFDNVLQSYQSVVGAALGEMKPVDVPASLKDDYEYLISPLHNSTVAKGECGFGGVVPKGRVAIDALVNAHRTELIENVLRGYNPGGRVYAALALLEMQKQGKWLSSDVQNTIHKLGQLEIKITTCSGCIYGHSRTQDIFRAPENYSTANGPGILKMLLSLFAAAAMGSSSWLLLR